MILTYNGYKTSEEYEKEVKAWSSITTDATCDFCR